MKDAKRSKKRSSSGARSESGSSSSSGNEDDRRRRKHKKHRKEAKKDKRERRHKSEKHARRDKGDKQHPQLSSMAMASSAALGPTVPTADDDNAAFGPALPPHLFMKPEAPTVPAAPPMIGPVLPSQIETEKVADAQDDEDDDLAGSFGPMPHTTQVELEERALSLKLAVLEGGGLSAGNTDQEGREEWMLELPDVGLKSGLAALNNMKRTFYQGKERPDFSDRSSWTKTPQSEAAAAVAGKTCSSKDLEQTAQLNYERQRDAEQERLAKKHKKKHKREESLVEIHQKKLRKEQKQKEKELAASGAKPERRPFTRDVDLKLNKIDKNQTKQIVDKAKILNTKFSSGQAKYL